MRLLQKRPVKYGWVGLLAIAPCLTFLYLLIPIPAQADVTPANDGTGTVVNQQGLRHEITGGGRSLDGSNLFHSFEDFGLDANEVATFLSDPAVRNILSRVVGGNPSLIDGLIQVTGSSANLYLMNPAGIVFGTNARLDVPGSFTATTADDIGFGTGLFNALGANDYGALVGDPNQFIFTMANPAAIINSGDLQVGADASLSLLGGTVVNTGTLTAPGGQVTITAVPGTNRVRIQQEGMYLSLEVEALPAETPATWTLPVTALPDLLTVGGPITMGISSAPDGTVTLTESGVQVPLDGGVAIASGSIDTTGDTGGTVQVLGDRVGVVGATIDASGQQDGGTILIGGDYQGNGILPNATRTYVSADSTIAADSLVNGNGGRIIIWADDTTAFYGTITATGGELAGDGGFAEVSGLSHLVFNGAADLTAPLGETGTLLLDPENIVISNVAPETPGVDDELPDILENDFPATDVTIAQATLQNPALANNNIILAATGNITLQELEPLNGVPTLAFPPGLGDITFIAGEDFIMDQGATIWVFNLPPGRGEPQPRTLTIQATNVTTGLLSTRTGIPEVDGVSGAPGGNVIIRATGTVNVGSITTFADSDLTDGTPTPNPFNGGTITIEGIGDDLPDSIDTSRGILSSVGPEGSGGDIRLEAEGDITTAFISTSSINGGDRAGDITIISRSGIVDVSGAARDVVTGGLISGLQAANTGGEPDDNAGTITLISPIEVITGVISTGAGFNGGTITITSPTISIGGDISTSEIFRLNDDDHAENNRANGSSGDVTLNGSVILTDDVSIITSTTNNGSGAISILNGIDSVDTNTYSLELDAGDNTISIGGDIGSTSLLGGFSSDGASLNLDGDLVTSNGDISLNTPVTLTGTAAVEINAGSATLSLAGGINAGTLDLNLISDDIDIGDAVTGTGTLFVQPFSAEQAIALGTQDTDAFDLDANELRNISGFSEITIGREDGSGGINVLGAVEFNDPTTLQPGQGEINLAANITTTGDNLTLGNTVLTDDVRLETGDGAIAFLGALDGTHNLTLDSGQGDIQFDGLVGGEAPLNNLTIEDAQDLTFGEAVSLEGDGAIANTGILTLTNGISAGGNLDLPDNAQSIQLSGSIDTSDEDLQFNSPVTLFAPSTITTDAGDIQFNSTINSEANEANSLILSATGDITFNDTVGSGNQSLGALQIDNVRDLVSDGAIATTSLQSLNGTGEIILNEDITTTGNDGVQLRTNGNLTVANISTNGGELNLTSREGAIAFDTLDTSSTANGGDIALNGNVNLDADTTITTGTTAGNITVTGDIADISDGSSQLNLITGGDVRLEGSVGTTENPLQRLAFADSAQSIILGNDIRTLDGLVFPAPVTLIGDAALTSTEGSIRFNDILASEAGAARNLTLDAANGNVRFGGTVGGVPEQALGNLVISRANNLTAEAPITVNRLQSPNTAGRIDLADLTTTGGDIRLETNGEIATGAIATNGGNIRLQSQRAGITTGDLNSSSAANGGNIRLEARDDLDLGAIAINSSGGTEDGGDLQFLSTNGDVVVGNLNASSIGGTGGNITLESCADGGNCFGRVEAGDLDASGDSGGNITIRAQDEIVAGVLDASANVDNGVVNGTGDGGDVFLDPENDIEVVSINAQGGTNGVGGAVDITTGQFFRATGSFVDRNGILASISTAGVGNGGSITIRHDGGELFVPFIVESAAPNGTIGAITTRADNSILPGELPYIFPGSYFQDNIGIVTRDRTLTEVPQTEAEEPLAVAPNEIPFALDAYFTRQIEAYFTRQFEESADEPVQPTPIKSLEQIQQELRNVSSRVEGLRPAIAYVYFQTREETGTGSAPTALTTEPPITRCTSSIPVIEPNGWQTRSATDGLEVVLVTQEGNPVRCAIAGVTREQVESTAEQLREYVQIPTSRASERNPLAQELYQWLIAPLTDALDATGINHISFVMDTPFRSLPLATLVDEQGQSILERYSVGLMPSVSLTDTRYANLRNVDALAMGTSLFEEVNLSDLPGADTEIEFVADWSDKSRIRRDNEFTPEELVESIRSPGFGIVHLATHARVEDNSNESFIQFYGDESDRLSFNDMRELGLRDVPVELLTLSACETALGDDDVFAELGFAGFAYQAGAKTVLASLFQADDAATYALMLQFYQNLRNAMTRGDALRQVQLSLLNGTTYFENGRLFGNGFDDMGQPVPFLSDEPREEFRHPRFWAAFTLIGNPW